MVKVLRKLTQCVFRNFRNNKTETFKMRNSFTNFVIGLKLNPVGFLRGGGGEHIFRTESKFFASQIRVQ